MSSSVSDTNNALSQADKFQKAAREAETDDSAEAFDAVLKRVANGKAEKKRPPLRATAMTIRQRVNAA
ncbi:hypothetical protein SAMN02745157_2536 [Kaistia soli DSM 19436]|uniref:Uncharacterized protein n=1 Tax=Kaistia soli DSM 19436 TaxID=1122133 RepID=A0A1M5D1V7_9HYPH|nr:hypothetical protein SAMN02745157_2536 [Kaistia soli DSM 19436]